MNTLHAIFDWLSAASFRASLLTIAVFLLQAALRRHLTARMRYALWLPVLIVLLMPVFPPSRWSVETVFAKPPQPVQITSAPIDFSPGAPPVDHSPPLPQPEPIDWQHLFIMAWLTGASGLLLFGSISFIITLRQIKRSRHPISDELTDTLAQIAREVSLRRVPRVWIASAIHSPAVTGFLRPTLLLPALFDRSFTPSEARLVLKHELMHLKRHDLPLNAVLCVLIALHWFNPLLWLAFFKARLDREAACDAQVLQNDSTDRRREYGHTLLKIETAFCPSGLSLGFVGIFQRGAALRSRIHSIATHKRPHALMRAIFIICVTGMTFLGITRAQQPPPPKEDAPLIAIEIKIIEFKQATDWDFGGRLPSEEDFPMNISLLSPAELNELLREQIRKDGVNITSYPRMVTLSDKEVLIKSVVNHPYKGKDGQIAHLPIGLVLKLKPTLRDQTINLGIDLTDSELIDPVTGTAIAEIKVDHPTARSRIYKTLHETRDGQSSVIAGWDDGKPQSKRPRLYVITPHVIKPEEGGLPGEISLVGDSEKTDNPASKPVDDPALAITTKLQTILLPRVQFRGVSIEQALEFLRVKSREFDTLDKTGVQFILRPGVTKAGRISLDLKDVPLIEALRYCTELAGLTYKVEPYAVVIGAAKAEVPAKPEMTAKSDAKATDATRANKISLPRVEFRDATLVEAIEFIRATSREHDPDKKGVNILIKGDGSGAKITLSLKNVPVSEALRYCAELSDHKLTSDAQSFLLTPVSEASPEKDDQAATPPARPAEEAAAAQATALRKAPKQRYEFTKAKLGDVLRFLATDAGINLFALADDNPVNQRLVTYGIHSSPFSVLETLCKANGLMLVLDQDRWFIRAVDDPEQIGKSYVLPQTQTSVETVADDPRQVAIGYPIPQTKASVDTILKDIGSILAGGETKPVAGNPQPSVQFKKEQNSVYVKASRLQHTWVSGYLQALGSSAQSRNTK